MNCGITGELKVTGFLLAVVKGYSLVPIKKKVLKASGRERRCTTPSSHAKARS